MVRVRYRSRSLLGGEYISDRWKGWTREAAQASLRHVFGSIPMLLIGFDYEVIDEPEVV